MLIVEGPDLVGKTTLCKELVKQLDGIGRAHDYAHLSRRTTSWQTFQFSPVGLYMERATRFTVQDRFHMSDPIYASVRNDRLVLQPEDYTILDCWLRGTLGAMTVVMFDTTENSDIIRSRWRDGEMYNLDSVIAVNKAYCDMARKLGSWNGYHMLFDIVLPIGPSDKLSQVPSTAEWIVEKYITRQRRLEAAMMSRDGAKGL